MRTIRRRPALVAAAVALAGAVLVGGGTGVPVSTPMSPVATILALGGNSNPAGVRMEEELDGYVSGLPGTAFADHDFQVVEWPAQIPFTSGWTGLTYDQSEAAGIAALGAALAALPAGEKVVVVGYSSSAGVVATVVRGWQESADAGQSAPSADDVRIVVMGNPARPNGGIFARFPGTTVPGLGVTFDPAMPQTQYTVIDVSWEYDLISDFPQDLTNGLAVLNAVFGFIRHGQYYDADPTDPAMIVKDVTQGNTRYITLRAKYVPLLEPLALFGVPDAVLAPWDAALRVEIEKAYDRTAPGTPTPATFGRPPAPPAPTVTVETRTAPTGIPASATTTNTAPESAPTTQPDTTPEPSTAPAPSEAPASAPTAEPEPTEKSEPSGKSEPTGKSEPSAEPEPSEKSEPSATPRPSATPEPVAATASPSAPASVG